MSRTLRRPDPPRPPRALTRQEVCDAALLLVDEEGLDALSMRRLGSRLGIEAMSLYHHVRDKADLLDALHAAVLGTLEPGTQARDWRALLGGLARALRAALLAHPNVVPLFTSRAVRAPEALGTLERVRTAMRQAGFSDGDIETAVYSVGMFTIGHAIFEVSNADEGERGPRRETTFRFGLEALLDGAAAKESAAAKDKPRAKPPATSHGRRRR
jgi:AcrR family transcriptional regulator